MTDFGSGVALDENFDLRVDQTGDLKTVSDKAEIRKDIAVTIASALQTGRGVTTPPTVADGAIGKPLTPGLRQDIRAALTPLLESDPRIESAKNIAVDRGPRTDSLAIVAQLDAAPEDITINIIVP